MQSESSSRTSMTLLGLLRLTPTNTSAWGEFVDRYGPSILSWCRKWGLQEADAHDVAQIVLLKLSAAIRTFDYDASRSFRAWLKTLTHNAWCDYVESSNRQTKGSGDTRVLERLNSIEARDDLLIVLQQEHDRELLERAMPLVERRVAAKTWQAFKLLTFENRSGKEVADQLGMSIAAAFVAKSRVQEMLREEIGEIDTSERD
jgi:RNA polymerase sigma factor (sigma-70 family)